VYEVEWFVDSVALAVKFPVGCTSVPFTVVPFTTTGTAPFPLGPGVGEGAAAGVVDTAIDRWAVSMGITTVCADTPT
jgi:hypothetical protein